MNTMNEPLTLEQLREMDGKPAWIVPVEEQDWKSHWAIRRYRRFSADSKTMKGTMYFLYEQDYGKTWLAYAYPPAHIDREAWEPCEYCNGKINLYQHTHTTKLFMNTFGEAATLVTECMACPPYADCCMNGISANSAFKINFCPNCGAKMEDES